MRATENFLRLIWPAAGEKAIVSIKAGGIRHHWFQPAEIRQAAEKVAELSNDGFDVYMGLGGFNERARTAENVIALKTLFLDLDCGPGKDYEDQATARTALDTFLAASQLPTPLVLSSGYGLHVYWPLEKELNRESWLALALGLKALCKTHNLNADHKVTADSARILRPIGSQNYKNGTPRRVTALQGGNINVVKDLKGLLLKTSTALFEDLAKKQVAAAQPQQTKFDTTTYPEADFDDILPRCATLRWAYENQHAVREPLWYAALGLANYCRDGRQVAHRISSRHPSYDPESTERKRSQWVAAVSGPPTCDNFRACPDSKCGDCPERVSTPLLLARPKNVHPIVTTLINNATRFTDGWIKITKQGMLVQTPQKPNADGTTPPPSWSKIADYGMQPLLNLRLLEPNGQPSTYVWMETHDENYLPLHNFVVPAVSINNSSLFAADCARNGVINEHETSTAAFKTFTKIMRTWISKLTKDQGSIITFRSFGWVGADSKPKDSFLLGSRLYTPTGVHKTPLLPSLENYQNDMVERGSLDVWTRAMDGYNLPGMEPYMFATWTAWGAPLMGFTNSGNIVFNLVGDTGVGKSSMQKAVISTYGNYESKILLDMHDSTLNSVNGGMGYLNSLPYCREEFSEKEAEEISTWVLTMTQGRERGRLTQSLNVAHIKTWSTIAFTSSNMSIREIVATTHKDNAARLARVWEQEIILPISQEHAAQIFAPLRNNYGLAGPLFIQYVVANYDAVRDAVINTEAALMTKLKATGQDRFNVSLLAACFVGAQIAFDLGLINHDLKRGRDYAIQQYKRLRSATKTEQYTAERILARFIQELQPNTLVVEHDEPGTMTTVFDSNNNVIRTPAANAVISARYAVKKNLFYVSLDTIRAWYTKNHVNFQMSMTELQKLGLVVSLNERVVLTKGTKFSDAKQTRCAWFDLSQSDELVEATK